MAKCLSAIKRRTQSMLREEATKTIKKAIKKK
jgi:hypothetical protein